MHQFITQCIEIFPNAAKAYSEDILGLWIIDSESIQYESSQFKASQFKSIVLHQHNHLIQRQLQQWWSVPLFQSVARELQKLISRTESPLSLLSWYPTMLWIHNQGGARYQIILLEDEKFFCFSHVSLWLSHLLRINFKLTVFIFFVFWNINSQIRDYQNQDWRDTIKV